MQLAKRVLAMKIANMVRKSLRQMTKANSANLTIIAKKKDDFLKLAVPKRLTLSKSQMKVEMILELNEQPKRLKKNLKKKKKEKKCSKTDESYGERHKTLKGLEGFRHLQIC